LVEGDARISFAELLTKARDHARSVGVAIIQRESRTGDVARAIIDVAQEDSVDIIVVRKRGAGLDERQLLSSVSQKLVSLAHLPVIVVP
jgi:nucleotide-binding universal stress UspA family protein